MRTMEISDAFDPILAELAKGEPVELRRANVPVAVIYSTSSTHQHDDAEVQSAIDTLIRIQERNTLGGISIKSLIDEGRP